MSIPEGPYSEPPYPYWADSHGEVEVDPQSLRDIEKNMHTELHKNFAPNYEKVAPDMKASEFGHHPGFEEANFIADFHNTMLKDAHKFVADYQTGLQALSSAAGYMAETYSDSDSLSANHISKVEAERAFDPQRGAPSVSGGGQDGAAQGTTPDTTPTPPPHRNGGGPAPLPY